MKRYSFKNGEITVMDGPFIEKEKSTATCVLVIPSRQAEQTTSSATEQKPEKSNERE